MSMNDEFPRRQNNEPIEPVDFGSTPKRRSEPPQKPAEERMAPPKKTAPKKIRKIQNRWGRAFVISLGLVGVSVFLAFFALDSASDLFGLNQPDKQIEITVKPKMSSSQIVKELEKNNVITKGFTFKLYSLVSGSISNFKPGVYILNSNMSYDEIIITLSKGDAVKKIEKITFYEGMSAREIADLLEEKLVCDGDEFLKYISTAEIEYEFAQKIPNDEKRFRKFEGYLFPDTYEFYVGEKVESVANRFFSNFSNKMTEDLYAKMKNMNMTLDQTITLASMIQEEASLKEEMGKVSSVFHNRLDNPSVYPTLDSDVTIFFVEKDIKPYLDKQNQEMYDAYNTYECKGLPVAPISNPGIEAIEAALNPEQTDYYFFVTDKTGKYYYSKTLAEHNQNVRAAARVDDQVAAENKKNSSSSSSSSSSSN